MRTRCPRCTQSCRILYFWEDLLGCRDCLGLVYRSTRMRDLDRAEAAAARIVRRIDPNGTTGFWIHGEPSLPPRPAGMRRVTYERLQRRYAPLHERVVRGFAAVVALLDRRLAERVRRERKRCGR